jgi:hypothetical protein
MQQQQQHSLTAGGLRCVILSLSDMVVGVTKTRSEGCVVENGAGAKAMERAVMGVSDGSGRTALL